MHTKMSVKSISIIGILVAMEIILARFSIHTWNLKIGFSFIPVVVAAIFYGPVTAGLVGAIGDIMGYILFPVGAYFPGFTLTAFVTGMIFGFFLRKSQSVLNIVLAVLCVQIFVSQFMTTYWISFLYGSPYWALFSTRIYQTAAMIAVEIISTLLIVKKVVPVLTRE